MKVKDKRIKWINHAFIICTQYYAEASPNLKKEQTDKGIGQNLIRIFKPCVVSELNNSAKIIC